MTVQFLHNMCGCYKCWVEYVLYPAAYISTLHKEFVENIEQRCQSVEPWFSCLTSPTRPSCISASKFCFTAWVFAPSSLIRQRHHGNAGRVWRKHQAARRSARFWSLELGSCTGALAGSARYTRWPWSAAVVRLSGAGRQC